MKKRTAITVTMMMEMCMRTCSMCMTFCAYLSDMFSISNAKHCAA